MADTREANPVLTAADAVCELFSRPPSQDKDIVWLADELIRIVQHLGSIAMEIVPGNDSSDSFHCRSLPSGQPRKMIGTSGPRRLFRPLLARLALACSQETGAEFSPYGGQYALTRSSRTGPVRLDVEFENRPGKERLTITRVNLPILPGTGSSTPVSLGDHLSQANAAGS